LNNNLISGKKPAAEMANESQPWARNALESPHSMQGRYHNILCLIYHSMLIAIFLRGDKHGTMF
jgi:hypothetical protein